MSLSFTPSALVSRQMEFVYHGNHWHASLNDLLNAISPRIAEWRPAQGGHTIFEIVHHLAYSAEEVAFRLRGRPSRWEEAESWVATPSPLSDAEWSAAVKRYADARAGFERAAVSLGDEALLKSSPERTAPYDTVLQFIHHEAFHGGQIAYLRRLYGCEALL